MGSNPTSVFDLANREYKYGFVTDIESETIPAGLSEDVVRLISAKKNEPEWLLEWRLKAYRHWLTMKEPTWQNVHYPADRLSGHRLLLGAEDRKDAPKSLSTRSIPSCSRRTKSWAFRCASEPSSPVWPWTPYSTASRSPRPSRRSSPRWASSSVPSPKRCTSIRTWCASISASVVPYTDNFFAALNSAVFTDGSFCYIPKGVRCPMELSTYFRINAANTGQFERTLIIADEGAYVSYLEGCTAPMRDENQLHAAVVELIALDDAEIKYSTVQNWYPGDKDGKGGIYNFVTKRGACRGRNSKISWTQVETGSAITWKYPSCILQGDNSVGEFYSVAVTNNYQQADTGTKMIHIGKNTEAPSSPRASRPATARTPTAAWSRFWQGRDGARNYSQCDSLLIGDKCGAHTFPYIEVKNSTAQVEHEASTSKIGEDQIFYCKQRGISAEDAVNMIVNGFCKEVFKELPMEFAVEAQKLLGVSAWKAASDDDTACWKSSRTSTPRVGGKEILRARPDGQRRRSARHHGPERLGQEHAGRMSWPGATATRSRAARSFTRARTCWRWPRKSAPARASSWPSSTRSRSPGVNNIYFLKAALNAIRKHRGDARARRHGVPGAREGEDEAPRDRREPRSSARSTRGSPAAKRSATRSSRWRCSSRSSPSWTRPTPASTSTRCRSSPGASTRCGAPTRAMIVVTHYQRLLNYIVPDFVHVLVEGRIVRSGGKELALELEEKGYAWLEKEPPAPSTATAAAAR